ncbi:unnamed protein product [Nesidiocoris tenuis]|uniref:Methuselah N-terminal domain-containing protein n=1 Tax=Nesidiocoris tenuis TaxID=355587 RepID=A0A6H5GKX9_9HEMI|nr:unnamed protein product [Nesidiocoris tenuis]
MFFIFVQSEISCRMHNFRLIGRGLEQISDKSVSAVADSDLDDFRIASFSVSGGRSDRRDVPAARRAARRRGARPRRRRCRPAERVFSLGPTCVRDVPISDASAGDRAMRRLLVLLIATAAAQQVVINRCCPEDHVLDGGGEKCTPMPTEPWAPAVYSPERGGFLDPGTVPEDWRYTVSRPTSCGDPEFLVTKRNQLPPFVVIPSGQLLRSANIEAPVPRDSYCLDYRGALVCGADFAEGDKIAVPKCCGADGAYSEKNASCVLLLERQQAEFSAEFKWEHRFPECNETEVGYTILGKLNISHWLSSNGSLSDDRGRRLANSEFCLEKIRELPDDPVHVFGCPSAGGPLLTSSGAGEHDIRFTIYPIGMFLSVFFLAVTLVASCLLPSTYIIPMSQRWRSRCISSSWLRSFGSTPCASTFGGLLGESFQNLQHQLKMSKLGGNCVGQFETNICPNESFTILHDLNCRGQILVYDHRYSESNFQDRLFTVGPGTRSLPIPLIQVLDRFLGLHPYTQGLCALPTRPGRIAVVERPESLLYSYCKVILLL